MTKLRKSNPHGLPQRLYERINQTRISWWCKAVSGRTMVIKSIPTNATEEEIAAARRQAVYAFTRIPSMEKPHRQPPPAWAAGDYSRITPTVQKHGMPAWAWSLFQRGKSKARQRGIAWALTQPQMAAIAKRCAGHCEVSGVPLMVTGAGLKGPYGPSLDRRDSLHGYTADNVRIVCVAANFALNSWGLDAFIPVASGIAERHWNSRSNSKDRA